MLINNAQSVLQDVHFTALTLFREMIDPYGSSGGSEYVIKDNEPYFLIRLAHSGADGIYGTREFMVEATGLTLFAGMATEMREQKGDYITCMWHTIKSFIEGIKMEMENPSKKKPICDGCHQEIAYKDPE